MVPVSPRRRRHENALGMEARRGGTRPRGPMHGTTARPEGGTPVDIGSPRFKVLSRCIFQLNKPLKGIIVAVLLAGA